MCTLLQNLFGFYNWVDVKQFCKRNVGTVLIILGVGATACWLILRKPRGIPPGPILTLPIIGDFFSLRDNDPRIPLRRMRKKYGDIFSFYNGQKLIVCLNGYDMIKEALVKNGDVFSDKPRLILYDMLFGETGIALSSGQLWKEQRKFAISALREAGFGKSMMEDKIKEEIEEYMLILTKHQNQPYSLFRITQEAVSNVIASMVFGQRFDYEDPNFLEFLKSIEEYFEVTGHSAIVNYIPNLILIPGDLFMIKRISQIFSSIEDSIINPAIREHEENYDEHHIHDFISAYLKEMKRVARTGGKSYIDRENLPYTIMDLFIAGSETTATVLLWTYLYFIHHPDIQARCYKEVQDVVGFGRLPSLKDKDSMPYTQAVILEVLRISNIVITNDPHSVPHDIVFRGYLIPKGTFVLPNLDSVLLDKDVWGDPDVFRPERFLSSDSQLLQKEELIPFSIGKRNCLGESLARLELFLFITTLVQRFELRSPDLSKLPTLKGKFGLTHTPENFDIVLIPR